MRQLDVESWARREHFTMFGGFDWPHFNLRADVDVTSFRAFVEREEISFNVATIFAIAKAANAIPEFRYRIRQEKVVEHDVVHPSSTIMGENDVFGSCTLEFVDDFSVFAERARERIRLARARPRLVGEDQDRDDLLFMTAIPWVSFTSFMHPLHLHPVDSIPRFAWGKFFDDAGRLKMPLSVQAHHALMDGLHAARFYAEVQSYFESPGPVLGERAERPAGSRPRRAETLSHRSRRASRDRRGVEPTTPKEAT